MSKHKHDWQLVKVYYKNLIEEANSQRFASFICSCGKMKIVKVKLVEDK